MSGLLTFFTDTFSPADMPGLSLWLDATDVSSLSFNGQTVSQWRDKSGNSNHAQQATALRQPRYVASAMGGQPALQFRHDGTNFSWFTAADSPSLSPSRIHVFAVHQRLADTGADEYFLYKTHSTPNQSWELRTHSSDVVLATISVDGAATISPNRGPSLTVGTSYLSEMVFDGTAGRIGRNGVLSAGVALTGNLRVNTQPLYIGAPSFGTNGHQGYLGEVLIYSRALSTAERGAILGYVSRKWGVAIG
jgi:hypothetical protein